MVYIARLGYRGRRGSEQGTGVKDDDGREWVDCGQARAGQGASSVVTESKFTADVLRCPVPGLCRSPLLQFCQRVSNSPLGLAK